MVGPMTDDAREAGWRESGPVLVQASRLLRDYGNSDAPRDPSPAIAAYSRWLADELDTLQEGLEQAQAIVEAGEPVPGVLEEITAYPLRAFSATVELGEYRIDVEGDTWQETAALIQATIGTIQPERPKSGYDVALEHAERLSPCCNDLIVPGEDGFWLHCYKCGSAVEPLHPDPGVGPVFEVVPTPGSWIEQCIVAGCPLFEGDTCPVCGRAKLHGVINYPELRVPLADQIPDDPAQWADDEGKTITPLVSPDAAENLEALADLVGPDPDSMHGAADEFGGSDFD